MGKELTHHPSSQRLNGFKDNHYSFNINNVSKLQFSLLLSKDNNVYLVRLVRRLN